MAESRECHINRFEEYSLNSNFVSADKTICLPVKNRFEETISLLLTKLKRELPHLEATSDVSVYTGSTGVAYLYFFLAMKTKNKELLMWPQNLLVNTVKTLRGRRSCFLNGDAGPLALAAVIFSSQNPELSQQYLEQLVALQSKVSCLSEMPDEMLYGRAGYLYALLFVNKYLGHDTINEDVIRKVVEVILHSGQTLAKKNQRDEKTPLEYEWHGKNYLGAAHGTVGIMYQLLQAKDMLTQNELDNLVHPTIINLMRMQFRSGNFPSSMGNDRDRLVQWCHGAPGWVQLFSKAYQVFNDDRFLKAALDCGEVVWRRGLLMKGYSICHGVAGNGYTFLQLYQLTGDLKHLHRAACFGEWCTNWPANQNLQPDRPFSLYEGIAGIIFFLTDLIDPDNAAFPAYTLP